ncbi:MAG: N-formylglutamate amidohydrolase [Nanoarchaeota archaeon]|nr:N-formylglutamate amidohydrolase [Nanoarchaeota archaeon]
MVEVIHVFNNERTEKDIDELIFSKERTIDYILSVPHSGVYIISDFEHAINLKELSSIGVDSFTDKLYDTKEGVFILTRLSKHLVNMNRNKHPKKGKDIPLHLQLGPLQGISLITGKVIKKDYTPEEKKEILKFYDKYHHLIQKAIQDMKKEHGYALMLDCHSMNAVGYKGTPDEGKERPDFVIGTLDDTSADKRLINAFKATLKKESEKSNLAVTKNDPYSGGYITQKYGDPSENVHVIQLEVNKKNYMDEETSTLNPEGLKKINSMITKAIKATSEEAKKLGAQV